MYDVSLNLMCSQSLMRCHPYKPYMHVSCCNSFKHINMIKCGLVAEHMMIHEITITVLYSNHAGLCLHN